MKIAMVNPYFMKGKGIDRVMFELGKRLEKWFDIEVICAKTDYYDRFVKTRIIPSRKIFGYEALGMYLKLPKYLKNYDLVNPHHEILNLPCLFSKKPVIATYHGFQRVYFGNLIKRFPRSVLLEIHALFYRFDKKIIAVSHYLAEELARRYFIPKDRIEVVYNGVDFGKFRTGKDEGYMLFVGRHERYKGVHELLELVKLTEYPFCLLYTSPSPRDLSTSRMPSSA